MLMAHRQQHSNQDAGFSLVEIMIAILVLSILAVVSLSSINAATRVATTTSNSDGAISLAYRLLPQADVLGCGAAIGSEPAVPASAQAGSPGAQPDALAQVYSRCQWGWQYGTSPDWSMAPPRGPCAASAGTSPVISALADTPWFCEAVNGEPYAVQLRTWWVNPSGTPPASGNYSCRYYTQSAPAPVYSSAAGDLLLQPQDLMRSVTIAWWSNGLAKHQTWQRLFPLPPDSLATHLAATGSLCIQGDSGTGAAPLALEIPNPAGGAWRIVRYPGSYGNIWFPLLPEGSYTLAQYAGGSWVPVTTPGAAVIAGQGTAEQCIPSSGGSMVCSTL